MAERNSRGSTLRAAFAVSLFVLLAAGGAAVQNGNATPSTKYYSTTLGGTPAVGATFTAQITLANSASSSQSLGAENVVLPIGYTATSAGSSETTPVGKTWNAVAIGSTTLSDGAHQVIQLRAKTNGDALAPGTALVANVPVAIPCTLPADTTWKTEAKQSNDFSGPPGNDFLSTTGTYDSSTHLYAIAFPPAAGSCGYRFVTPGSDPLTDWAPGTQHAGAGFSTEVAAVDSLGNLRTNYTGTATMSGLGTAPSGATPTYGAADTGTHAVSFSAGIASFTTTAVKAESGVRLTATDQADATITSTSASFDVLPGTPASLVLGHVPDGAVGVALSPAITVDVYDAYGNKESCATCTQPSISLSLVNDAGGGTTLGGNGPTSSVLGTATFSGLTLDTSGSGFTLHATSASPALTSNTSNAFTIYDGICSPSSPYKTCSASKNGTSIRTDYGTATLDPTLFQISAPAQSLACGSATTSIGSIVTFQPAAKDTGGTNYTYKNPISVTLTWDKPLVPGTGVANFTLCLTKPFDSPWGAANTYRVVQDCPSKLNANTLLPCASSRHRDNAGDLVITLLMGSGDPIAGLH